MASWPRSFRSDTIASHMIPADVLEQTSRHIAQFASEWRDETPLVVHRRQLDGGGTPGWSGEFMGWITRDERGRDYEPQSEERQRVTRAMRMLRKVAPREHETLWRIFSGESVEQVCAWLNERSIRHGHPERYSMKDTVVIIVSGVDKLAFWG